MGARSSATGDRVAPQPAVPPRRRWLLSAWTGSLNFVTALATKQALKVKPCETIEIVPLRERAERRPALSHSRIAALSCLSAAFTRKQRRPQTGQLLAAALNRISPANARDACSDAPVSKRPNRHAVAGRAADLLSQRLGRHRLLVISARTTNIGAPSAIRQNPRVAGHPPARLRKAPDRD